MMMAMESFNVRLFNGEYIGSFILRGLQKFQQVYLFCTLAIIRRVACQVICFLEHAMTIGWTA